MQTSDMASADHLTSFVALLDALFRRYGEAGLPGPLRAAVADVPRQGFVHRFRARPDGPLWDCDEDLAACLPQIYSDRGLIHVDAAGTPLPSTNSQPSYVLWLLHKLGLEPGHRVLEVGSGSGWLAAIMSRLVGETGHVTGIEIIPELAAQSRMDAAAVGLSNLRIHAGDGTLGYAADAPYDRVMFTAATWDLPAVFFEQIAEGGRLLLPIALRGGDCQVAVLEREGAGFRAVSSSPGWFVSLIGDGQRRGDAATALASLPFWSAIAERPGERFPFWLGLRSPEHFGVTAEAFRSFLRLSEPGFTLFDAPTGAFGIVDLAHAGVAMCEPNALVCWGSHEAGGRLARAYVEWTELAMPGMTAFDLEIVRSDAAPVSAPGIWIERRGQSSLVWRLKPGARSWRTLLAPA
jgi:protein-L-isoaspartate(D-aspartate) O-methyltransferase